MVKKTKNLVLIGIISIVVHVTGATCNGQHRISRLSLHGLLYRICLHYDVVGLFKPLSYQTRAVQLVLTANEVCFETYELSSTFALIESKTTYSYFTLHSGIIVCELLSDGVVAFITDQPLPSAVKYVIDTVQIPVMSTTHINTDHNSLIINLTPSEEQVANALSQLLVDSSWTSVVLITWPGSGDLLCTCETIS